MHRTVNTVFIDIATGEEIKDLPTVFDFAALRENLILSTHKGWDNRWRHYKVVKVEEQAGDTVVVQVKYSKRYYHRGYIALVAFISLLLLACLGVGFYFWDFFFK